MQNREESKLEPALFYYRPEQILREMTHVDDLEGGVDEKYLPAAFERASKALDFATNHMRNFTFRGREIRQHVENGVTGHTDLTMHNYALTMQKVHD